MNKRELWEKVKLAIDRAKKFVDEQHAAKVIVGGGVGALVGKKVTGDNSGATSGAIIGALAALAHNNRISAKRIEGGQDYLAEGQKDQTLGRFFYNPQNAIEIFRDAARSKYASALMKIAAPEMRKQAQYMSTQDRLTALGKVVDQREKERGFRRDPKGHKGWAGSDRISYDDMANIVADDAERKLYDQEKLSSKANTQFYSSIGAGALGSAVAGSAVGDVFKTFRPPAGVPRGRFALKGGLKGLVGAALAYGAKRLHDAYKENNQQAELTWNDARRTLNGAKNINEHSSTGKLR